MHKAARVTTKPDKHVHKWQKTTRTSPATGQVFYLHGCAGCKTLIAYDMEGRGEVRNTNNKSIYDRADD